MQIPYIQSTDQTLNLLQQRYRAIINPALATPILSGRQINGVVLIVGSTSINHGLGRVQQGWFTVDATVNPSGHIPTYYRSYSVPFNANTLNLSSTGPGLINIWVY